MARREYDVGFLFSSVYTRVTEGRPKVDAGFIGTDPGPMAIQVLSHWAYAAMRIICERLFLCVAEEGCAWSRSR